MYMCERKIRPDEGIPKSQDDAACSKSFPVFRGTFGLERKERVGSAYEGREAYIEYE